MTVARKNIDQITRSLTSLAGTERLAGRDGSGDFKILVSDALKNVPVDFSVATNKFTVAADTGNTVIAGTLGVGITPRVWDSVFDVIQIGPRAAISDSSSGESALTNNAYYDDTDNRWEYMFSGFASLYAQFSGGHTFFHATSGTLDNPISWVEDLTIDNSGNTGIAGDFSVATNKFTVAAATGNTVIAGDVALTAGDLVLSATSDILVNTDRFVVDADTGNITQGVTLKDWSLSYRVHQMNITGALSASASQMGVSENAYFDRVDNRWEYITSSQASLFAQAAGRNIFLVAASGTADDAITWFDLLNLSLTESVFNDDGEDVDFRIESDTITHALFVDGSSGNVGIGTSTPDTVLQIQTTAECGLSMVADSANNSIIYFGESGSELTKGKLYYSNANDDFRIYTANGEKVRIDSNGNTGFNTTSFGTSSQGVLGLANAAAIPTGNPTGGGVMYAEGGALKWRGSSGTITTIAPA